MRRAHGARLRLLLGTELPLALILAFGLLPWIWMMLSALRPSADWTHLPLRLLPSRVTVAHVAELLAETSFLGNLLNSLVVAAGTLAFGLALAVPAAYAFSRFRFRGRKSFRVLFLVVNMFPVVLLILPLFIIFRWLHLLDTYPALILADATFALPFAVWLLSGYMESIPRDLDEAAMIDGATRLQTMRLVIMPLALPGIVAVGIYLFIASWNEYLFALMLSGERVRTVTVALQMFIGENEVQWGLLTAGGTLVALPVVLLFLAVQRHLVSGLTGGAVKG
jgi:multiple sugar transport system permease protein